MTEPVPPGGEPPPPAAGPRAGWRRYVDPVVYGPHGVRSGWRILLFFAVSALAWLVLGSLWAGAGQPYTLAASVGLMLAATLLASGFMMAVVERRTMAALGLPLSPVAARETVVGTGIGGAALGAAALLLLLTGTAGWVADTGTVPEFAAFLAGSLAFLAVAAAAEEVVFRGYPFQVLVQGIGVWPTVLATSAAFAAAHLENPNVDWVGVVNIFLAGVMLAVAYLRTRSLWFATGVHLGWNWMMAGVLDFPVSGFEMDTPLYDATVRGPAWWTGGAFGPEAGIPATLVLVALTVWLLRTPRLAPAAEVAAARPLVDDRIEEGRWP